MRLKQVLIASLVLGFVFAPLAFAQGNGRVEGRVFRAADGRGIGGVVVVVTDTGDVAITDSNGNYSIGGVPAGTHTLAFTLGDNATSKEGVEVVAGSATRVDQRVPWDVSFVETITVVSASRRAERIVDAPSAVTVVSEQEIARQASHGQLPKLLEFTPGAEVTQSGLYDYNLNTRGFNSSLNRRVATLVDGRDASVPFLGAQEWAAVSFPLDDLASAELVRGPSAALYGANASSGVLNLVTRQPRYSQGGTFRLTGGELSTVNADFRWAGSLGNDWYSKIVGGARTSGDFTTSRRGRAEYARPCTRTGQTDCLPQEVVRLNPEDDNEIFFGGLRLDKHLNNGHTFTVEGGQATVEGPVFQTGIGRVQLVDIERPWTRLNYNTNHWNLLGYWTQRDATKQTALASGTNLVLDTERLQVEAQGNWGFAEDRGRVVVGLSFAQEDLDSFDPATGRQTLIFQPISNDKSAFFGQVNWNASDRVKLVLAARVDENDLHDTQFSPKASLVYAVNSNNTLRLTYNEAFQVPNYSEFFLQANAAPPSDLSLLEGFCLAGGVSCGFAPGPTPVLALGNKNLQLEEVKTIELGYSGILNNKAFLTVDYYNSDNKNFITDLLTNLNPTLGRINPNFAFYTPPAALPAPLAGALLQTIQGLIAQNPSLALLSNNVDGSPIIAAASYTNFGAVDTQGIDVGLNYYFDSGWNLHFAYSWFDFSIQNQQPGLSQILLPNSPENKASFGYGFARDRWDANVSFRWVDDFRWVVGPFQGEVPSYLVSDIVLNYMVNENVSLGLNLANVGNEEHWESFGGDVIKRRALASVAFSW